jgi:hypothetical protein
MIAQRVLHIRCHDRSLSRVLTDLRAKVTAALQKLIFDAERRRRNALGGMVIDTQLRARFTEALSKVCPPSCLGLQWLGKLLLAKVSHGAY